MTFSKKDEKFLRGIITTLAKTYDAPVFRPHLTIYGGAKTTEEKAKRGIARVITGMNPFEIFVNKLDYTDDLFKTVFLSMHDHPLLSHINWDLRETIDPFGTYSFQPHISLIYKKLPEKIKKDIITSLDIKQSFRVESITLTTPGKNRDNWNVIEEWEEIDEKKLDGS